MTFRVIVTGSRNWEAPDVVRAALDGLAGEHPEGLVVVHGACPTGADAVADSWARDRGVRCARWRADWRTFGRAAGPRRNQAMVEAGADVVLAFVRGWSRGTLDCAERARAAGIPVRYSWS